MTSCCDRLDSIVRNSVPPPKYELVPRSLVWFDTGYSVYTMRQASRRSWRIGQRLPVRVVYFAYRATLQPQALSLVAKKLQASLAIERDLVDEGLAAHGSADQDFLLTLARSLTERAEENEESIEGLFAEVQRVAPRTPRRRFGQATSLPRRGRLSSSSESVGRPLPGKRACAGGSSTECERAYGSGPRCRFGERR